MTIITTYPRCDGFGAQFLNILVDIIYTKMQTNNTYIFPDIKSFEHNYDNDPLFREKLINYMNLKQHFPNTDNVINVPHYETYPGITYSYCDHNLNNILNSSEFKELRNMFFENKQTPFDTNFFNMAVHVRRNNQHDSRVEGSDTPDNYYLNLMQHFRCNYKGTKPIKFHIYSQSPSSNFAMHRPSSNFDMYLSNDTELHIDEFVLDTFNGLVFADGLITSRSAFSYAAALLNGGTIYYKRCWHAPAENWIIGDDVPPCESQDAD